MFKKRRWLIVVLLCLMLATVLCCAQIGLLGVLPSEAGAHIQARTTADYSPWEKLRVRRVNPILGTISAIDNSAPPIVSTQIVMLITNTAVVAIAQNPTSTPTLSETPVSPTATASPSTSPTPPTPTATATPTIATPTAAPSQIAESTLTLTTTTRGTITDTPVRSTSTPRSTRTLVPTVASVPSSTSVPSISTSTPIPPSATPRAPATNTSVPPSSNTPIPPATNTNTPIPPTATNTPIPPTATNTNTLIPPSITPIPSSTPVPTNTNTPIPPSITPTATNSLTPSQTTTPTNTPTASNTPVNYLPLPQQITSGVPGGPDSGIGAVFFTSTFGIAYPGGPVILSGNSDGTGNTVVDDVIFITVTHPDSSVSIYMHNYDSPWNFMPQGPVDVSAYFQPGNNLVTITLADGVFGGGLSAGPLWLGIPIGPTNTPTAPLDLAVSKTVDNVAPAEGTTITYTITLNNVGASTATGIQVSDFLPSGLTFVAADAGPGTYDASTGIWAVGSLASGANITLYLSAMVNNGTAGSAITDNATLIAATPADSNAANNVAAVTISPMTFVGSTDLALRLTASAAPIVEGGTLTYNLSVTNNGGVTATNLQIADVLPAGLTLQSATGAGAYNSGTGQWTLATLGSGARATIILSASVDAGTAGQNIVNNAAIMSVDQSDPNAANNIASVARTIVDNALSVALTVDNASPNEAQLITYTVTLTSHAASVNTGIQVTDLLPATMTFSSAVPAQGTYNNGTGVWDVGTLASGASTSLTIVASPNIGTGGTQIANAASISAASLADSTVADDSSTLNITVNTASAVADLGVTIGVSNAAPREGATITYTVTLTNNGPQLASGIQITQLQPAGITLSNVSASQGSYDPNTHVWSVGSLIAGGSATLTLDNIVNPGTGGTTITDTASITAANQTDPVSGNDSASVPMSVTGADLAVSMSASNPNPSRGSTFVYTITVTNNGPDNTTNVQIIDSLPTGLTFTSVNSSQGSYDLNSSIWTVGNLAASASATLNLTVSVDSGTLGGTISNTASVTFFTLPDPNSSNNSATMAFSVLSRPNRLPTQTPTPRLAPTFVPAAK